MSTLQAALGTANGNAHTNVTSKTAPNSITPAHVGLSLEEIIAAFTNINFDTDSSGNIIVGDTSATHVIVDSATDKIQFKNGSVVVVEILPDVDGKIRIRDGADNFYTVLHGTPFSGSLTANLNLYPPINGGSIVTNHGGTDSQVLVAQTTMTITHGLGFTPSRAFCNAFSGPAAAKITGISGTTLTVTFNTSFTGTAVIDWQAFE